MQYFKQKIGDKGAKATFYLQEANAEIDINRKSPVMVVVPGGAYMWTSWREEEPIALEFFGKGFSCVVAEYATEGLDFYKKPAEVRSKEPVSAFPNPLIDLCKTIALIREHADEWNLDTNSINVIGFSAGGNLTAQLGCYWNQDWLEDLVGQKRESYRPDSICLAYGAPKMVDTQSQANKSGKMDISLVEFASLGHDDTSERRKLVNLVDAVSVDVPPTFIWHTMEDPYVPVADVLNFATDLEKHSVPFEMHIYQKGKHGLALADLRTDSKADRSQSNAQAATWKRLYLGWLTENKLIKLF